VELVLVRHALPVRADAAPDGGRADPGLSERGREQAARLPAALAGDRVDVLCTSPLRRARETAEPVAAALGLEPVVVEGVAEFDSGDASYVPVEELRAAGDPRWQALVRGELYSAGVDPAAFRATVVAALADVAAQHPGGRAVLVSHAGVINAAAGDVLGQQRPIWFAPAYCSLTRLAYARDGRRGVVSLNETAHVRDLLH
jgi:2,3-bisphosphoglycerate-dependent phosphoglycerate mutase